MHEKTNLQNYVKKKLFTCLNKKCNLNFPKISFCQTLFCRQVKNKYLKTTECITNEFFSAINLHSITNHYSHGFPEHTKMKLPFCKTFELTTLQYSSLHGINCFCRLGDFLNWRTQAYCSRKQIVVFWRPRSVFLKFTVPFGNAADHWSYQSTSESAV
jgi:hypothetical protein